MRDEIVHTTGRRMTRALQSALDDITGADRRAAVRALGESSSPVLGALHQALALELSLCELREDDTLRLLADDMAVDDSEHPYPPVEGVRWSADDDSPPAA